jgi:gliding motility-associated-like protein
MKKLQIFLILFLSSFFLNKIAAQIPAPKLLCLKNDTLIWQTPNVVCGAFKSYKIFASRSLGGPYLLLGTVTNPATTRFYHASAGSGTWFYFMQSDFNCPGQLPLNSDTIENALPDIVSIASLNVINTNQVALSWKASSSKNIIGYVIYKKTTTGFIPIDTVTGTSYIDIKGNADIKSEQYQILALNQCGVTSLYDLPNNTILIKGVENKCVQKFILFWNKFQNWSIPVSKYEVWVSFNNKQPLLFATLSSLDTIYEYPNVIDQKNYKFYIKAVQAVTGNTSKSNIFEINSDVIQPVTNLYLTNVTFNSKNKVEIFWIWNENAKVDSVLICKSTDSINFKTIAGYKPKKPIGDLSSYVDTSSVNGKAFYQIKTIDACDSTMSSNKVPCIWLSGTQLGGNKNVLTWNPLDNIYGKIADYTVYRIVNGVATPQTSNINTFVDPIGLDELRICYLVEAKYELILPNGTKEETSIKSNKICIDQKSNVFVPNAFTPGGYNPEFKPIIGYKENIVAYEMSIFDRYGEKLYTTSNKDDGWNGTIKSSIAPEGVYSYRIFILQTNGESKEFKGSLVLLR